MKDSTSTDFMHLSLVHRVFFHFNPLTFVSHLMSLYIEPYYFILFVQRLVGWQYGKTGV